MDFENSTEELTLSTPSKIEELLNKEHALPKIEVSGERREVLLTPDTERMVVLAELCEWAYESNHRFMTHWRRFSPHVIEGSNNKAVAIIHQNRLILAFRGSSNLVNWLNNLAAVKTTGRPSTRNRVHSGFNNSYNDIREDVRDYISKVFGNSSVNRIHITGHSLGGAMAQLCAVDCHNNRPHRNYRLNEVVTFGQPRPGGSRFRRETNRIVGSRNFARFINYKSGLIDLRVNRQQDPVVSLPSWIAGFRHAGRSINTLSGSGVPILNHLSAHFISNYVIGVKKRR